MQVMKIRYLKVKEEFELEVPDPLKPGDSILVRISDYDLFSLLRGIKVDVDDDTYLGIELLREKWNISVRTLTLAKRQQHLRKLNRSESAWVILNEKKRKPRRVVVDDRIKYLRDNFDEIAKNCVKHGWYDEFFRLCKDLGIGKKSAKEKWYAIKEKWRMLALRT